jgi:uncharacterized protein (TIGR02996 family)
MSMHEAFLQSIIEAPDDDVPRLAYADWLEENGDQTRAEFIRVQCRLATTDEDDPQRRELQRREYELLADHCGAWAGPLVGRVFRWKFRRGFVEQLKLNAEQFRKGAKWLLDFAPIRDLQVWNSGLELDEVRALAASKHLRRITSLDMPHARMGDEGLSLLAQSPNLAGLTHLSLQFNEISTAGLVALAGSTHLRSLRSLDVTANDLPSDALEQFVASCRLPLDTLWWDDEIAPAGITALAASPLAGQLKRLNLRGPHLGPSGMRVLAESSSFTKLEELTISEDEIGPAGVAALARSPLLAALTSLALPCVEVGDEAAVELARSAQPASLRRLDLGYNGIGPAGAKALADAPLGAALTRLELSSNPLGDPGVKALAKSPHLTNLHRLDLSGCGISRQGVKALLASPHLDRLTCLQLERNPIGRKAFDDLHTRLGERLYHEHFDDGLNTPEIIRRVRAEQPRCLRGLGARPDTELLRRFPRKRLPSREYACVAFELTHPDPTQKAVLLGDYDNHWGSLLDPYAIRWEPSGEQREFFDLHQHGRAGEDDACYAGRVCEGKRKAWKCGRRGCRDHTFLVTFLYRLEYPPTRRSDRYLPFADQFYHIDLDAYCAGQDRVIEIASFEANQ